MTTGGPDRCESWTIKKDEHQRIDAFELWCWKRLLGVPWYGVAQSRTRLKRLSSSSPQSQPGTQTCPLMAQPSPPTLVVSLLICGILDDIFGWTGRPGVLRFMGSHNY